LGVGGLTGGYGFAWRADGALLSATGITGSGSYSYDTAGLLTSRTVGTRITGITARDGEGRPEGIVTTVSGVGSVMTETLAWSPDGLLASHTLNRPDFTDARAYAYANLSRRLVQEQQNLNAGTAWTNTLAYDNGQPGGPGCSHSWGWPAVHPINGRVARTPSPE